MGKRRSAAVAEGSGWGLGIGDAEEEVLVVVWVVYSSEGSVGCFDCRMEGRGTCNVC